MACLLVLLALSRTPLAKAWYAFFLLSSAAWLWVLWVHPQWTNALTLFILPLLWLAGSLKVSSPLASGSIPHPPDEEPRTTQEQIRGPIGRLEALKIYFLLLAISLVLFLAFYAAFSSRY